MGHCGSSSNVGVEARGGGDSCDDEVACSRVVWSIGVVAFSTASMKSSQFSAGTVTTARYFPTTLQLNTACITAQKT